MIDAGPGPSSIPGCRACRGSGWIRYDDHSTGKRRPWAGACYCPRGLYIAGERDGSSGNPKHAGIRNPVLVAHAPREHYLAAMEKNADWGSK